MRKIGERRAILVVTFTFAFQQAVEVAHQAGQFARSFRVKLLAVMFLQLAHLFGKGFNRAEAPPRSNPQERDHQQQVGSQNVHEPVPDHIRTF